MADIVGDWREEVILWNSSNPAEIFIYTSQIEPEVKRPCLMCDHQYRMSICWQNTAYNQPPHAGFYMANEYPYPISDSVADVEAPFNEAVSTYNLAGVKVADGDTDSLCPGVYVQQDANRHSRKVVK